MTDFKSGSTYSDELFERLKLGGIQLESISFVDCSFAGCSMVEASMRSCRFQRCKFVGCDLSLVEIQDCEFISVEFEESKLVGLDWTRVRANQPTLGKPIKFKKSILNHSTFIGLNLKDTQVVDCTAHDVDFREADLSQVDLSGSDLQGSLFMDTNLSAADLRSARNYQIDPTRNKISGARFSLPEAMSLIYNLDIELDDHPGEN